MKDNIATAVAYYTALGEKNIDKVCIQIFNSLILKKQ